MRKVFLFGSFIATIASCNHIDSAKKSIELPKAPASVEAAKAELKAKSYSVEDIGTINLFNEYDWASASKDTSSFVKEYLAERRDFALQFLTDSTVKVTDDKKAFEAKYNLANDTSKAVLLNLTFVDSSFSFNPGEAMNVTSTYKIKGIDKGVMLVETPRELNRRKVVVIMKGR